MLGLHRARGQCYKVVDKLALDFSIILNMILPWMYAQSTYKLLDQKWHKIRVE